MTDDPPIIPAMIDPNDLTEPDSAAYQPVDASVDPSTTFFDTGPQATFGSARTAPPAGTLPPAATGPDRVTCPECGAVQDVHLNRREAVDFCRNCDFPLFWTPSDVVRERSGGDGEALRRLPGTVGRTSLASMACPSCAELNLISAATCIRCGQPMHPVIPPPPPPEPIYVPPPPVVEPEPERGVPWWVWVLAGAVVVGVALLVLFLTNVIN